jgi:hypothetical protein
LWEFIENQLIPYKLHVHLLHIEANCYSFFANNYLRPAVNTPLGHPSEETFFKCYAVTCIHVQQNHLTNVSDMIISLHEKDRMYKIPPATSFFRNARESTPFSFIDREKANQYNKASPQETQKTGTSREANYSQKTPLISTSRPPRQCHQTAKLQAWSNS